MFNVSNKSFYQALQCFAIIGSTPKRKSIGIKATIENPFFQINVMMMNKGKLPKWEIPKEVCFSQNNVCATWKKKKTSQCKKYQNNNYNNTNDNVQDKMVVCGQICRSKTAFAESSMQADLIILWSTLLVQHSLFRTVSTKPYTLTLASFLLS